MQWSCTCSADSPKWPKLENYFGANADAPSLARPLIVIFHVAPSSRPRRRSNRRIWTQFYANRIRWFSMLPTESWLAWFLSQMLLVGIAVTHFRRRRGNRLRYNCSSDRRTRFFLHQIVRSSAPTFSFFHFFIGTLTITSFDVHAVSNLDAAVIHGWFNALASNPFSYLTCKLEKLRFPS